MATIIDAFIVTLGLDPTDYNTGQKKALHDLDSFKKESEATAKQVEQSGKKAAAFFGQVRTAALGFFTLLAGQSLTQFANAVITSEANVGRLAKNLGIATEDLSAWEGVVRQAGGTAQDADAALSGLATTLFDIRQRGDVSKIPVLNALGLTVDDLQKPTTALLKLAEAAEKLPRDDFYQKARLLGIPDTVINTLTQGRQKIEDLLEEQKRLNIVTDESAEAGARFQKSISEIQQSVEGLGREFLNGLNPQLEIFSGELKALATNPDVKKFFADSGAWFGKYLNAWDSKGEADRKIWEDLKRGDVKQAASDWWTQTKKVGSLFGLGGSEETSGGAPRLASSNMEAQFQSAGLAPHVIRGIMAGISAESNMDPNAVNPTSGAFGYGQWLGPRKAELFRRYGDRPTPDQQIQFMIWELMGGDFGGKSVLSAPNEGDALNAYVKDFMRPSNRPLSGGGTEITRDLDRGYSWLQKNPGVSAGNSAPAMVTITGPITINTRATDTVGIARDLSASLSQRLATQFGRGM